MIDPTHRSDAHSRGASEPRSFDPATPGAVPVEADEAGGVVLLLVSDPDRRWAGEVAVELSTAWARDGRRVVLADLHLENPVLHELIGTDNHEGVVDIFLYGASIARSARPVAGRGIYLISAGTYEADADAIYGSARWSKLAAGFREAGATLVLFAPLRSIDLDAIAGAVTQTILLGDPAGGAVAARLAGHGLRLAAVLVPPAATAVWEEDDPALLYTAAQAQDPDLLLPPPPVRPHRRSRRGLYLALALLLAMAALAAAGYWVSQNRPDLLGGLRPPADRLDSMPAVAVTPPPAPTRAGHPLPYSVRVIAYTALAPAAEQLAAKRSQFGEVPFFITPEEIEGVTYFQILAGALPDTVAAKALRDELVAAGAIDEQDAGAGSWSMIQETPLAFDLGEFASTEEASATADSLAAREIPVYRVPVPYSDGSQMWQLYAGAYRDSASAGAMRARLGDAGVPATLVPRVGQAASPAPTEEG